MDDPGSYDGKLQHILKEASAIFAAKSYHKASVRDISAATGISLSGLYYYFKSKEELLFLIQSHCFETILERLDQDLEGVTDSEASLRVLIRNHVTFFADNMAEMKVLSHEDETLTGEMGQRVRARKRAYADRVYVLLEALAPDRSAAALRAATFSLFGSMNWIYTWYRPDRDEAPEVLADRIVHQFLLGFRAPPPPAPGADAPGAERSGRTSIWREP